MYLYKGKAATRQQPRHHHPRHPRHRQLHASSSSASSSSSSLSESDDDSLSDACHSEVSSDGEILAVSVAGKLLIRNRTTTSYLHTIFSYMICIPLARKQQNEHVKESKPSNRNKSQRSCFYFFRLFCRIVCFYSLTSSYFLLPYIQNYFFIQLVHIACYTPYFAIHIHSFAHAYINMTTPQPRIYFQFF